MVGELKTRIDEMKLESSYQLRVCDQTYTEKIKDLTEKFIQQLEQKQEIFDVSLNLHLLTIYLRWYYFIFWWVSILQFFYVVIFFQIILVNRL